MCLASRTYLSACYTIVIIACSEWASGAGLLILSADLLYDATAIEQAIATRRARTALHVHAHSDARARAARARHVHGTARAAALS